jgi:biopolymer transport protein ExbB
VLENIVKFVHGGGLVMYPLLAIAIGAIIVIVERLLAFRQYGPIPPGLLPRVLGLARQGKVDEARELCGSTTGPLSACLFVVLSHRNHPTREVERLIEETGQDYFIRLERLLPVLDTITTIAPLLGLLGTIVGMIGAFNAIAMQTHRGNTDSVLSGVGEALYATATGLIIAVICFAAYNYFAARLRSITAETEQGATKLMNLLEHIRQAEKASVHGDNTHILEAKGGKRGIQTPA